MKIDTCLIASDLNDSYVGLWPYVYSAWKSLLNIEPILLLISDKIPDFLIPFKSSVRLFEPIDGISTVFQAQCIRLLYPCLLENKTILISDADIIPLNKNYFLEGEKYDMTKFVVYRNSYFDRKQIAMCYNLAHSSVWKRIFQINSMDDVRKRLKDWFSPYKSNYTGQKNCAGWFTDQEKLYQCAFNYKDTVILDDKQLKFKRLDKRNREYIIHNLDSVLEEVKNKKYTDFHVIRPFRHYISIINKICQSAELQLQD